MAEARGNYAQVAALFEKSLALFGELGDRESRAAVLCSYGQMLLAQGQHERAPARVAAVLRLFEELGEALRDRRSLASALTVQGQIMHRLGDYVGWPARAMRRACSPPPTRRERSTLNTPPDEAASVAALRQTLDAATFAAAWEEGCTMVIEQILAAADEESLLEAAIPKV